jgi:hypothetical protein
MLWSLSDDPDVVVWLIRGSGVGWLCLGPLSLDMYLEILADSRSRLNRLRPFAYATAAVSIVLYQTPWCVGEPVRRAGASPSARCSPSLFSRPSPT